MLLLASATGAAAQSVITPEEFLDYAVGKTLTFSAFPSGRVIGREHFFRRDLSVWRFEGEVCVYGQITIQGRYLCFLYDDDADGVPICWLPYRSGELLLVRTPELVDAHTQMVTGVNEDGLQCPETPVS